MAPKQPELTAARILDLFEAAHAHEEASPDEGLRDRKKRRLRQRISNVATSLFLAEGFDQVSVARIAAACEVSEPTVFNYFPTKEAMFFDRSGSSAEAIAEAVRHRDGSTLAEAVMAGLTAGGPRFSPDGMDERMALRVFRQFCEVATNSPALRAAQYADLEPWTATVGEALAERVGSAPGDPEVGLATMVVGGLARVRTQSTFAHVRTALSMSGLESSVAADLVRAMRVARPALEAFDANRAGKRGKSPTQGAGSRHAK